MNNKIINIMVVICLVVIFFQASVQAGNSGLPKKSGLQIYLPRDIEIKNDTITLGEVAIIRGHEPLVAKAERIMLGRISVPGQQLVFDKTMILSRLVSNGIKSAKITLTGAEKITVKQQNLVIKSDEFVGLASKFMGENPLAKSVFQAKAIRRPEDLILQGEGKTPSFVSRLVRMNSQNLVKVQIAVLVGDEQVGMREVVFRLKYNCRRVVALSELQAGTLLTSANTRIEEIITNYPEPVDWTPPYGLVAKHRIPANSVVRSTMVGVALPEVVIKRNQSVVMRIEKPGLMVTAMGQAMQDARAGDFIKVKNMNSRRIVFAKVNKDGTVEPVY